MIRASEDCTALQGGGFAHADQPHPTASGTWRFSGCGPICNSELYRTIYECRDHLDTSARCVPSGVGYRFLNGTQDDLGEIEVERVKVWIDGGMLVYASDHCLIFVMVMASQFGRRRYSRTGVIRALVTVAIVEYFYLKAMPFNTFAEWSAYAIALALGLLCGAVATVATRVQVDSEGAICRTGFLAIWGAVVLGRLIFIWAVTDASWAHEQFGMFLMSQRIEIAAIAPFFVIWALTMVVVRMVAVEIGIASLTRRTRNRLVTA